MSTHSLHDVFIECNSAICDTDNFVRAVLSGRRRNFNTPFERIDIRPVRLRNEVFLQISYSDGRQMTSKNLSAREFDISALMADGYANLLVETTEKQYSVKITKKGEPLYKVSQARLEQNTDHDKQKARLLNPGDAFFREVGITDSKGEVKPSMRDKYKQVEEFLRLLVPTVKSAIEAKHIHPISEEKPLTIIDLGCGHAYLTFAAHRYFESIDIPVRVIGVDIRESSRERNDRIARNLGISATMEFRAEGISENTIEGADVAIALHACDTATDDAIAWAVNRQVPVALFAPCCHHDIQAQINQAPEPWSLITRSGIMKERLADLITDALRMQLMKLRGYRVEAIEFVGGEHTPRNLMIRSVLTGAPHSAEDQARYAEMVAEWGITPVLEGKLSR